MSSKQREALLDVYDCAKDGVLTIRASAFEKVTKALAEPIRNCEVGTAEQQIERFIGFCTSHKPFCIDCPFKGKGVCGILWAQMPYEEGDVK